jgi:hypothetical protein
VQPGNRSGNVLRNDDRYLKVNGEKRSVKGAAVRCPVQAGQYSQNSRRSTLPAPSGIAPMMATWRMVQATDDGG